MWQRDEHEKSARYGTRKAFALPFNLEQNDRAGLCRTGQPGGRMSIV